MELWDAYDCNGNKIDDITLQRGKKIPFGLYHLVCDVIVKHIDGTYLLMQRDMRKTNGGKWEATAGGSALQNESPYACALRELQEETGIDAHSLVEVGKTFHEATCSIYVEFLCIVDINKQRITLQEGETINYCWVSEKELCDIIKENALTKKSYLYLKGLMEEKQNED